jgi:hypothetical protein
LTDVTIDNSDGDVDEGGHNTDAFDVGSSTGITISGATVYNQDDCLAVNSGTVWTEVMKRLNHSLMSTRISPSPEDSAQGATDFLSDQSEGEATMSLAM